MDTQTNNAATNHFTIKIITGILLAFFIALVFSAIVTSTSLNYLDKLFYSRFIYWGEAGLLWFYACKIEHQPLLIWPEEKYNARFLLKWTGLLLLLFLAASILSSAPTMLGFKESNAEIKKMLAVLKHQPLMLFFISLTAGVTEEVIFRGYVLTRLSLLIKNKYLPVIISSAMFSALHYRYHSPREYIFSFLIGLIFGFHYQKYRNIKVLMLVHFLIDFSVLILQTQLLHKS